MYAHATKKKNAVDSKEYVQVTLKLMSKLNKMHAPIGSKTLVPLKDIPFPLRNRLINERKMYEAYQSLIDTRNDLIDIRAIVLELKTKIENENIKKEYKLTLKKRQAAFLPQPHVSSHEMDMQHIQSYIDTWNAEIKQAELKPINPHLWNLPSIIWLLICLVVHGYGLFVADASRIQLEASSATTNLTTGEAADGVALCRNATDWILVLSCFFIATSSINIVLYYVVYPFLESHSDTSTYRYYKKRYNELIIGVNMKVCLPLHVLVLVPWLIYGFVLFFNPLAGRCQNDVYNDVYYYGFIYSIFPGTVFVLLGFVCFCVMVYKIIKESASGSLNRSSTLMVVFIFVVGFVSLYVWFFVHVVQVGEKQLTQFTLVLNNRTGTATTTSIELAQTCAAGAQYLIDAGLTTLVYSGILVVGGMVVPFIAKSLSVIEAHTYEKIAPDCMVFLLSGRMVIELVFGILGGVLFFNSDRYACGAELFGFGLGVTIVFIFSSVSTCNQISAQQSKKKL